MNLDSKTKIGQRVALVSVGVSALLALAKILIGLKARSTAVVADGVESAGDVVASGFVLFGFLIASRPSDKNHPYGYGRYETLAGLVVGNILMLGGAGIAYRSLQQLGEVHAAPALFGIWPLLFSMVSKAALSRAKFHYGKEIRSSALIADAWNDFVDILSAITAMAALVLTLYAPSRFLAADHYGGCAVGLIVIFTGLRIAKKTTDRLTDAMPPVELLQEIRSVAKKIKGVYGVEKCYARSSGLQYYVDLHIEVDREMTVLESHDIATAVRFAIRDQLDWVADVLVHVEPWAGPGNDAG